MGSRDQGITARVAKALEKSTEPLAMGALMAAAGIEKTSAAEVSSALYKLRHQGKVRTVRGPSSSPNGPQFVRRYVWVVKAAPVVKNASTAAVSPLSGLGLIRGG